MRCWCVWVSVQGRCPQDEWWWWCQLPPALQTPVISDNTLVSGASSSLLYCCLSWWLVTAHHSRWSEIIFEILSAHTAQRGTSSSNIIALNWQVSFVPYCVSLPQPTHLRADNETSRNFSAQKRPLLDLLLVESSLGTMKFREVPLTALSPPWLALRGAKRLCWRLPRPEAAALEMEWFHFPPVAKTRLPAGRLQGVGGAANGRIVTPARAPQTQCDEQVSNSFRSFEKLNLIVPEREKMKEVSSLTWNTVCIIT